MDNIVTQTIREFDSLGDMASKLGVSYQLIQQWRGKGKVPPNYCPKIERLTNGKIRCEQLNSDVDWAFVRSTEQQTAAA